MIAIIKILVSALLIITMPLSFGIFGNYVGSYKPKNQNEIQLNFAAISDTHLTDNKSRNFLLTLGLTDISKAAYPVDALLITGDITNHGAPEQWESIQNVISKSGNFKNVILAAGNHDLWGRSDDVAEGYYNAKQLFIENNKIICNRDIDNVYYTERINGYTFIVLGSEENREDPAYFSNTQLIWLNEQLKVAAKKDKPIFVVCHQPINESHGLPGTWPEEKNPTSETGGIGEQSGKVEAILKQYKNVFLISGHLHNGFGKQVTKKMYNYNSVESDGSFHSINLPSYSYTSIRGQLAHGTGFCFEVYKDEVVIRARSFSAGVWYTLFDYTIPLV